MTNENREEEGLKKGERNLYERLSWEREGDRVRREKEKRSKERKIFRAKENTAEEDEKNDKNDKTGPLGRLSLNG